VAAAHGGHPGAPPVRDRVGSLSYRLLPCRSQAVDVRPLVIPLTQFHRRRKVSVGRWRRI